MAGGDRDGVLFFSFTSLLSCDSYHLCLFACPLSSLLSMWATRVSQKPMTFTVLQIFVQDKNKIPPFPSSAPLQILI